MHDKKTPSMSQKWMLQFFQETGQLFFQKKGPQDHGYYLLQRYGNLQIMSDYFTLTGIVQP